MSAEHPPLVLVANPRGRRATLFLEAAARRGVRCVVVPYASVLADKDVLAAQLRAPGTLVRLESPGEDWELERALIALGADAVADGPCARITAEKALALAPDHGRIFYPRQWYAGFVALLQALARDVANARGARFVNAPGDIAVMFDKRACHARFAAAGVPVAPGLGPVRSYEELRARMDAAGAERAFVKLAYGSSASGVVAYSVRRGREEAVSSADRVSIGDGAAAYYNSLRLRRYTRVEEISSLIDWLGREGAHAERWLPKATLGGKPFDLRVLTIAGAARHVVVRVARSGGPFTNLHLGNARGDLTTLRARAGEAAWAGALATCERAAAVFPECLYAGIDLLLSPGFSPHAVLECNAFGDLLPGVRAGGLETYDAELEALFAGAAGAP